jgi:6-pyruvoyl-tetrahydropterin synthase
MKVLFSFLLFTSFNFIIGKTIEENEEDLFNFEYSEKKKYKKEIIEIYPNPYFIFHIPPWSDFSKFTEVYMKLKKKYLHDESEEGKKKLKNIELAYKKVKEDFEKDKNYNNIFNLIRNSFFNFIFYMGIIYIFYFLSWIGFKIQGLGKIFSLQIIAFILVNNFIPHYFNNTSNQYVISFIFGLLLFFIFRKKNKTINKNLNQSK